MCELLKCMLTVHNTTLNMLSLTLSYWRNPLLSS